MGKTSFVSKLRFLGVRPIYLQNLLLKVSLTVVDTNSQLEALVLLM